jgi:hypothetical protein
LFHWALLQRLFHLQAMTYPQDLPHRQQCQHELWCAALQLFTASSAGQSSSKAQPLLRLHVDGSAHVF